MGQPAGMAASDPRPLAVTRSGRGSSPTAGPVDAAALNAGIGAGGAFVGGTELEEELRLVDLNVRSTVHLAKRVLEAMAEGGRGRVLFTSSIAAPCPAPSRAGSYQRLEDSVRSVLPPARCARSSRTAA